MEEALKKTVLNCASTKMDIRILKNIDATFKSSKKKDKKVREQLQQNVTEMSFL